MHQVNEVFDETHSLIDLLRLQAFIHLLVLDVVEIFEVSHEAEASHTFTIGYKMLKQDLWMTSLGNIS